ncbi:50S ribosomal protein L7 [Euryarchaeota archaeon SM23-78]|nr:MAG: 50S ribosomal protein L7 [Euryarchaeota archaeon SM23-78]MBW3000574.1 ribosomal L7Ae/L30e/S12e/Gadd45 family protein [Candidatus Woesearchaeota archaeon]
MSEKAYEAIELARKTGKIIKGTNEVTKAIEKEKAKLVVVAKDVTPPEITMHIPLLAKEKGILVVEVPSKEELGAAAGLKVGTASVAIVKEGEAKDLVKGLGAK